MRGSWLAILLGCCASLPDVIEIRDVREAGGAPSLIAVVDLGGRASRSPGPLVGDRPTDGVATIGELVLLRGDDLGRLPTVTISGQPAAIEAFTTDGVLVRVPPGVSAGDQLFVVEHALGRAERRFPIRKWALVLAGNGAHAIALDGAGPRAAGHIPVAGARDVRFSADGSVAYVLGDRFTVIDVAAQRGPRLALERDLPLPAEHIAVARDLGAGRAALVSRDSIVMIDVTTPYQPAFWSKRTLPPVAEPPSAVELDDSGRQLALLLGNRVSFVDVSDVAAPAPGATVDLLPGVLPPLATHLRFSDGVLWTLTGGNPRSASSGVQPVRLVRIQNGSADAAHEVAASGDTVGLTLAPETRRVRGSTIHASAMSPLLVGANGGSASAGAIHRVDGEGVRISLTTPEALLAMGAAPGALLGVVCRDGNLVVVAPEGASVELPEPCPAGGVTLAVQP